MALLLGVQIILYVLPHLRPGPVGWLCWMIGSDGLLWLGLAGIFLLVALAFSLWRRPLLNRWRVLGLAAIFALAGSTFMFRVYPSSHDGTPSAVHFRLPLDGPILVGWGGDTPEENYHVAYPDQRYAYDLLVARDGSTHQGEGRELADYYCYGLPVLAPADGKVIAVLDGRPDQPIAVLGGEPAGGNQVVIEVAPREFLFLCHLSRGSILVKEGDPVSVGQPLAKVGNSGNTSEPHLHIHLQDTPRLHVGEGIPLLFWGYRADGRWIDRGMPTGGFSLDGPIGQTVEHEAGR
ncbi:MAG TPA: M23 family metallopeptidase [Pirellulaceae bacterium]|nr:M23 family metallopeptidase [Pirellulaceae bacterium]